MRLKSKCYECGSKAVRKVYVAVSFMHTGRDWENGSDWNTGRALCADCYSRFCEALDSALHGLKDARRPTSQWEIEKELKGGREKP